MKTFKSVENITLKVTKNELVNGKWLNLALLSSKLQDLENEGKYPNRYLRTKLYNTTASGKLNTEVVCGMKCVDVKNPMKVNASINFTFEVE